MMKEPIHILIVDDSATASQLLKDLFQTQKDMRVIGWARNGEEAIKLTEKLKPDIITMDINMPFKNGLEATQLIMQKNPTPIVVISSTANDTALNTSFLALEAGALFVLPKPENPGTPEFNAMCDRIIDTVRSMSQVKVIKRRFHTPKRHVSPSKPKNHNGNYFEIVAVGVSVGGPQALKTIFCNLPVDFPVPIVVVQHMSTGFLTGFAQWLNRHCVLNVKEAEQNEFLLPGTIYFAPDNHHLEIKRVNDKLQARLVKSPPVSGFCPSATVLLSSVAKVCGKHAIGILLTGMGNDGAQGLLDLKNAKGHTLIQNQESAVVFGMAGVAQSLNATDKELHLDEIADYLMTIFKSQKHNRS